MIQRYQHLQTIRPLYFFLRAATPSPIRPPSAKAAPPTIAIPIRASAQ